jgi:diacylglycerol kinase (ATP)
VHLRTFFTSAPGCASAVIRTAEHSGCEAALAAGGDGTFNDLLQAAIATGSKLPLGVVPIGSGNVLAQELGMPVTAAGMARGLAAATSKVIAAGRLSSTLPGRNTTSRYFTVAAGIGADARVICGVNAAWKARIGIGAYYLEAARQLLFSSEKLPSFRVEFADANSGAWRSEVVSQLIAERVGYFGRCLRAPNGSNPLLTESFRLLLFKTKLRLPYLRYGAQMLASRLGLQRQRDIRGIEIAYARSVRCLPDPDNERAPGVLAEVDGEMVGGLPAELRIVPNAFCLLLPMRRNQPPTNI